MTASTTTATYSAAARGIIGIVIAFAGRAEEPPILGLPTNAIHLASDDGIPVAAGCMQMLNARISAGRRGAIGALAKKNGVIVAVKTTDQVTLAVHISSAIRINRAFAASLRGRASGRARNAAGGTRGGNAVRGPSVLQCGGIA